MKPPLWNRHRHRFKQKKLNDDEFYLNSRGLQWNSQEFWYEDVCSCGEVNGQPHLGRR